MSFTNQTTHYGLPQWIGSDKPTYLVDQNNAYQTIDAEIYNANTTAGAAQTAAEGAVQTAGAASTTASDALTAAQTASSTADNALTEAQTANTNAQAAQTAAGAAQTAAQAAQEAAAGNSITNLAPAYDPTITYAVDDLVTAEGKLYKCIVAVTSPEQFDINKWDDVTTSKVYMTKTSGVILKVANGVLQYAADTSKTIGQYIDALRDNILTDVKAQLNGDDVAVIDKVFYDYLDFHIDNIPVIDTNTSTFSIRMSAINIAGTTQIIANAYKFDNSNAGFGETIIDMTNNTMTSSDKTNDASTSATCYVYYSVYKNI